MRISLLSCLAAMLVCAALFAAPAQAEDHLYYVPYVSTGPASWTGIALRNIGSSKAENVVVDYLDSEGNQVMHQSFDIDYKGHTSYALDPGVEAVGWLRIKSDKSLAGLCFVGTTFEPMTIFDVTFMEGGYENAVVPHVAEDDIWSTYVALANPASNKLTVTLRFRDDKGKEQYTKQYTVPAKGSRMIAVSDLVGGAQVTGSLNLNGDRTFSAFALYTSLDKGGVALAGIEAVAGN